jgi:hypothetical protein
MDDPSLSFLHGYVKAFARLVVVQQTLTDLDAKGGHAYRSTSDVHVRAVWQPMMATKIVIEIRALADRTIGSPNTSGQEIEGFERRRGKRRVHD